MTPHISDASLERFRAIWREQFGEELSPERARQEAETLVRSVHWIFSTAARLEQQAAKRIRQDQDQMLPMETPNNP